jgi:hypothetical protein
VATTTYPGVDEIEDRPELIREIGIMQDLFINESFSS